MPNLKGPLVVALLYDGLCTFELGIVTEVFGLARPEMGENWYRFATCALEVRPYRANGGFSVVPDHGAEMLEKADLLIIPGWTSIEQPVPDILVQKLYEAHQRGSRLASICSGAFVLAAAGLLDNTTATTHWRYADAMRRAFPSVNVDEKSLFRFANGVFTSAGGVAGIDLLIEIVRQDYGPDAANSVARRIVMSAHRSGGQAQFIERPVSKSGSNKIAQLMEAVRQDIASNWSVARMAAHAGMSRRTFERRFMESTGLWPGDWLSAERVEIAKDHLTSGAASVEAIATTVGFSTSHSMRHQFKQRLDVTPIEYRNHFKRRSSDGRTVA
jgi:AraC family transcriptional regulator, transcriptional activator FtrA